MQHCSYLGCHLAQIELWLPHLCRNCHLLSENEIFSTIMHCRYFMTWFHKFSIKFSFQAFGKITKSPQNCPRRKEKIHEKRSDKWTFTTSCNCQQRNFYRGKTSTRYLRGHSLTTTLTRFCPFLTTYLLTYPGLTFVEEFLYYYKGKSAYRLHFPYHLPTSSCPRSYWMPQKTRRDVRTSWNPCAKKKEEKKIKDSFRQSVAIHGLTAKLEE